MARPQTFDVGRMRQRITWQTNDSGALDAMNEPLDDWLDRGTFWAEVLTDGGVESPDGGQVKGLTKGRIKMRNVGPIKPSDRIVLRPSGRVLDLMSVSREGERDAYLLIEFTETKLPQ